MTRSGFWLVHPPPVQLAGFVSPVSLDAAPLCFDAAYDALGTATIAANAIAATTTLIFEVMRSSPTGVASWQTEVSTLLLPRTPGNMWRRL